MRRLRLRFRSLFRRNRVEQELDDEMQFHFEKQVEANLAAGMSRDDARQAALRQFGDLAQRTEECRDARRMNWLENAGQDIRYALRGLRRDPMLAWMATLTLAICIGANTTIFSIVNTVLLRPLPYPGAERIYWIGEILGRQSEETGAGPDYYSLRDKNRVFEDIAAFNTWTANWSGAERADEVDTAGVTPSFFQVMGTRPMLGRTLAPDEQGPKAPPVAVLSYRFWRNRLGSDVHAVGKTVRLDGMAYTVVGVMPQGYDYPRGTELWLPLEMDEATQRVRSEKTPMRVIRMAARLKPGVGEAQLASEMARLTHEIHAEYPKIFETAGFISNMKIFATPLQRRIAGDLRPALMVLSGAVGLVLLIACANLANLLLARSASRRRELAVRLALGSARGRIIRQMLAESLALALPGGVAGVAMAFVAIAVLNVWQPLVLQHYPAVTLDGKTLGFTLILTLLTGLVFGIAPALAAAGVSIQEALKSSGYATTGARRTVRLRQGLVVAELSVSLTLLIAAGLLGRSFLKLANTPLGFEAGNLLTLRINLDNNRYGSAASQALFYREIEARVRQIPLVRSVALSTDIPLSGERSWGREDVQVIGRPPLPLGQRPVTGTAMVNREFFQTLGIPLRRGRVFESSDGLNTESAIVVNETFVREIFPSEDPVGQRIRSGQDANPSISRIIGVVGDIRGGELGAPAGARVYYCYCQTESPFDANRALLIRTASDPHLAVRDVEMQVRAVDRDQPAFDVKTMDERMSASLAPQRFHLILIGCFAAISLVLAALGVYGVMAYLVAQRTREIGIRVALGARAGDVMRVVMGESVILTLAGVTSGICGAWGLTRYVSSMLYGVSARDGLTFILMPVVLLSIAIAAAAAPASRASRIDPVIALREE